jgi:hypothetical protein
MTKIDPQVLTIALWVRSISLPVSSASIDDALGEIDRVMAPLPLVHSVCA